MCLVLLAWKKHPDLPLVLATNRDELHRRPSAPLRFWQDVPILGGRDLQTGGTWLGMDPEHRVAVVTNWHRSQNLPSARARSRGDLIRSFLTRRSPAARYAREVHAARHQYNGFSLLLFDQDEAWYVSSEVDPPQPLQPGLYGLANAGLEADDPRIQQGRTRLARWLEKGEGQARELLDLLADAEPPGQRLALYPGPGLRHLGQQRGAAPTPGRQPLRRAPLPGGWPGGGRNLGRLARRGPRAQAERSALTRRRRPGGGQSVVNSLTRLDRRWAASFRSWLARSTS